MSKLNKILSLIICFAMVVISVPAVSMVSADTNYSTSPVIDEATEYDSFADATDWSMPASEYVEAGVDADGNITYTHKNQVIYKSNGSYNGNQAEAIKYTLPESVVAEDTTNRTTVTTNNYKGKVEIDMVYDVAINDTAAGLSQKEDGSSTSKISNGFFSLNIGNADATALSSRIYPTYFSNFVSGSNMSGSMFAGATDRPVKYIVDTSAATPSISVEGGGKTATADLPSDVKYISQISLSGMQRLGEDSKMTFDSISVKVTPSFTDAEKTMFDTTLGAKLVDDVNNVTGDITLPTVDGVTWTSSNSAAISNTGAVSKIIGQTQEATLTATFAVDGITYKKHYTMTVAADESVLPDEPVTDAVTITDNIDYTSFDEAEGWSMADDDHAKAIIKDGKLFYEQIKQTLFTSKGAQNTATAAPLVYTFPNITVAEDTENNTKITTNNYRGEIDVTVTYDANLIDPQGNTELDPDGIIVFNTYYTVSITNEGLGANVNSRTYNNRINNYIGTTSYPKPNQIANLAATNRTVTYSVNTAEKTAEITAVGSETVSTATLPDTLPYVSNFQVYGPQRHGVGSYLAIDKLEIKVIPQALTAAELSAINSLVPETLVSGVVDSDITIPSTDGVTWSTSDAGVITADGKITKTKGKETTATLTASFESNGIKYNKEYDITVAAAGNVATFYVDGEVYNTVDVKNGNKLSSIDAPAQTGKTFVGWYEEDATESFDFDTVINSDINLYAKYETTKYKVYFRVDSFINEDLTMEVAYGSTIGTLPAVPEKNGYTAIGWLIDGTQDELLSADTVVEGNIYVDASYGTSGSTSYTVTFVSGEETIYTTTAWPGYTFTFPEAPTKENYTFSHWERNGEEFKETDVMLNKDITLNAVFTPNPVEVKFYSDESTLYITGTGYYDTAYGELPGNPSADGKAFKYWELENGDRFTADTVITGPVSVYAVWDVPVVIVDEDITKYTSLTGGLIQFDAPDTDYTTVSFDGGLKMLLSDWEPLSNTGAANGGNVYGLGTNFRALVDSDDEARTKTYMNSLVGEYEVEFVFDLETIRVTEYDGVSLSESFMQYNLGALAEDGTYTPAPFTSRLKNYTDGGQGISIHAYDANKVSKSASLGFAKDKTEHSYTVHFNTYTDSATAWTESSVNSPKGGDLVWLANPGYINAIRLYPMLRMGVGSYFKLKNVKITEYSTDTESEGYKQTMGLIEQLPDSLVTDPNAVTESFTMPEIEGIKWTTSDSTIVDIDGTVNRWYDDLDVILTATAVSADGYKYSKEYALTVEAFDFEKESITIEMDENNWSFANRADVQEAKYSFDGESLKVEKVTGAENPASIKESKTYYAYFDLYSENSSDDYTVTSISNYEGVYDIELDIENGVTSMTPMNIAIGYKNGESFFSTATLKISNSTVLLTYPDSGETTANATVYASNVKNAKLKVRVDAVNNLLSAWIDGSLAFKNIPYVSPFPAASGVDMFSTVRVGVDTNNNAGDYVVVKDINLDMVTAEEISSVTSALDVANGIAINALTDTPANVSGNLKSLPSNVGDYTISWTSNSSQVDVTTGEVFFDETASDVVVSAYIRNNKLEYPVTVRKDFKLHIRARESDAEYGQYLINSLGRITNQDYSDIRYDLNLPVNEDITWQSSDTSVIGTDGKLNMSAEIHEPKQVKITASAYGSSKEYVLTVSPRTAQNTLYTGSVPATLSYSSYKDLKASGNLITEFDITGSAETGRINILDEKGSVIVSVIAEDGYFYFDYKGSDYANHTLAENATKNIKILTMSDIGKLAIWVDGVITDDFVDYRSDAAYVAKVESTNANVKLTGLKITADDYGMLQLNIDNLDYFSNVGRGVLSEDITLPTASITNAGVEWKSGNTSLLTDDGKVTTPDTLAYTTLNFKITDSSNTNVYIEKNFDIVVECDESKNIAGDADVTVSKHENKSYAKENVNDSDYDTAYRVNSANTAASDITFDLGSEKLLNTMFIVEDAKNIREFTLYASNDNSTWTEVYSGNMADISNGTVKFDTTTARYMKLTIESSNTSTVDINEIKFYLFASAEEIAQLDMNALKVPSTATKDLELTTLGTYGTVINWTSSNEDVISATGKLTKPDESCTVTLTATAAGTDISRTFEVYVSSSGSTGPTVIGGGSGSGGGGAGGGIGGANANVTVGPDISEPIYTDGTPGETNASTDTIYDDVKTTDWFCEDVLMLTEKGIVSGDGTGRFNPNDKVTREQFLKMLLIAADVTTDNADNTFVDVDDNAWYTDYVLTAKKLGVVNGISEIEFGIGSPISRQDMAVFIERLINIRNIEVVKYEVEDFADAADVSAYAADAVANMKSIGLIQGYNNYYYPKDSLTRAEAATVIASLLELIEK